ncbi:MAG TPA: MBL fold metallo-hydrolase [Vicinamibacterales bacterium]|jgi:glyoxylase-like metal-dependent hydrolase (beta-lactamase superfamily II)|nr:MBL fold metallo-hydrolase [Vicinamibacterales bacterium]
MQIVNDAAAALGGSQRLIDLRTIVVEGDGMNGNLGQDMTPEATGQAFELFGYKRSVDVNAGRVQIEQTRTPNFVYFQGQQSQHQLFGVDGEIGYNIAADRTPARIADAAARDRLTDLYHHPIVAVRAALIPGAKLSNPRTASGQRIVDVLSDRKIAYTLAIDARTNLPTRVVSMTDNTNLGDVAIETTFADYRDVNGLKMPFRITTKTDRYTTTDIRVRRQFFDGIVGDITAPVKARTATPIIGPPAAVVTAEEVGKGVWFLAGQSHHSVLVEFGDHLTLIEAPQNEVRARGVIAKAKELRPDKPLTEVVNTHHHFDHSGGLRAAVAEGLTVFTRRNNVAFYQTALTRPHMIAPDLLTRNRRPLKIEAVDDQRTLQDDTMTMTLYHVAGSPHADTLLMAYLPKEKLLVEADVFSPQAAVHPYAANLIENIKKHGLAVDRILPIHGTITSYAELLKTQTPQK